MPANLCRSHLPPRLEALPAKHRTALGRLKRHRRLLAALRATGASFHTSCLLRRVNYRWIRHFAFRFAVFATTGFILELLIVEEQLFAGCEDEFGIAVDALQYLVLKLHEEMLD